MKQKQHGLSKGLNDHIIQDLENVLFDLNNGRVYDAMKDLTNIISDLKKGLNSIINPLMNIVDMYLDEEQNHYEESVAMNKFKNGGEKNHIFHDLLAISHWIKENHTMKEEK